MTRKELGALLIEKEFDEDVESDGEQIKAGQKSARRAETLPDCHKNYDEKVDYSLKTKFVGTCLTRDQIESYLHEPAFDDEDVESDDEQIMAGQIKMQKEHKNAVTFYIGKGSKIQTLLDIKFRKLNF